MNVINVIQTLIPDLPVFKTAAGSARRRKKQPDLPAVIESLQIMSNQKLPEELKLLLVAARHMALRIQIADTSLSYSNATSLKPAREDSLKLLEPWIEIIKQDAPLLYRFIENYATRPGFCGKASRQHLNFLFEKTVRAYLLNPGMLAFLFKDMITNRNASSNSHFLNLFLIMSENYRTIASLTQRLRKHYVTMPRNVGAVLEYFCTCLREADKNTSAPLYTLLYSIVDPTEELFDFLNIPPSDNDAPGTYLTKLGCTALMLAVRNNPQLLRQASTYHKIPAWIQHPHNRESFLEILTTMESQAYLPPYAGQDSNNSLWYYEERQKDHDVVMFFYEMLAASEEQGNLSRVLLYKLWTYHVFCSELITQNDCFKLTPPDDRRFREAQAIYLQKFDAIADTVISVFQSMYDGKIVEGMPKTFTDNRTANLQLAIRILYRGLLQALCQNVENLESRITRIQTLIPVLASTCNDLPEKSALMISSYLSDLNKALEQLLPLVSEQPTSPVITFFHALWAQEGALLEALAVPVSQQQLSVEEELAEATRVCPEFPSSVLSIQEQFPLYIDNLASGTLFVRLLASNHLQNIMTWCKEQIMGDMTFWNPLTLSDRYFFWAHMKWYEEASRSETPRLDALSDWLKSDVKGTKMPRQLAADLQRPVFLKMLMEKQLNWEEMSPVATGLLLLNLLPAPTIFDGFKQTVFSQWVTLIAKQHRAFSLDVNLQILGISDQIHVAAPDLYSSSENGSQVFHDLELLIKEQHQRELDELDLLSAKEASAARLMLQTTQQPATNTQAATSSSSTINEEDVISPANEALCLWLTNPTSDEMPAEQVDSLRSSEFRTGFVSPMFSRWSRTSALAIGRLLITLLTVDVSDDGSDFDALSLNRKVFHRFMIRLAEKDTWKHLEKVVSTLKLFHDICLTKLTLEPKVTAAPYFQKKVIDIFNLARGVTDQLINNGNYSDAGIVILAMEDCLRYLSDSKKITGFRKLLDSQTAKVTHLGLKPAESLVIDAVPVPTIAASSSQAHSGECPPLVKALCTWMTTTDLIKEPQELPVVYVENLSDSEFMVAFAERMRNNWNSVRILTTGILLSRLLSVKSVPGFDIHHFTRTVFTVFITRLSKEYTNTHGERGVVYALTIYHDMYSKNRDQIDQYMKTIPRITNTIRQIVEQALNTAGCLIDDTCFDSATTIIAAVEGCLPYYRESRRVETLKKQIERYEKDIFGRKMTAFAKQKHHPVKKLSTYVLPEQANETSEGLLGCFKTAWFKIMFHHEKAGISEETLLIFRAWLSCFEKNCLPGHRGVLEKHWIAHFEKYGYDVKNLQETPASVPATTVVVPTPVAMPIAPVVEPVILINDTSTNASSSVPETIAESRASSTTLQLPQRYRNPPFVQNTLQRLEEAGYQAYLTGEYVLHVLSGRDPHYSERELVTNCPPETLKKVFSNVLETGNTNVFQLEEHDFDNRSVKITFCDVKEQKEFAAYLKLTVLGFLVTSQHELLAPHPDSENDLRERSLKAVIPIEELIAGDPEWIFKLIRLASRFQWNLDQLTTDAIYKMRAHLARLNFFVVLHQMNRCFLQAPESVDNLTSFLQLRLLPALFGSASPVGLRGERWEFIIPAFKTIRNTPEQAANPNYLLALFSLTLMRPEDETLAIMRQWFKRRVSHDDHTENLEQLVTLVQSNMGQFFSHHGHGLPREHLPTPVMVCPPVMVYPPYPPGHSNHTVVFVPSPQPPVFTRTTPGFFNQATTTGQPDNGEAQSHNPEMK